MNFTINGQQIGRGCPLYFIAEAGVNHNGSTEIGKKLIDIASISGADAVKFQTFNTENIITPDAPKSTYHIETTGADSTQSWFDLLKTQEMSEDMHIELIEYCNKKGITFLSTPYDNDSVDLLDSLNVSAFKIASTDTNNLPFLSYVAKKGRPMILSSAMSTMDEVIKAVQVVRNEGLNEIAILQCTGNYPAEVSDSNLRVINTYSATLNCVVGYSDHTLDIINPIAATSIGASIYEKHFTLDKNLPGPDHRMSLNPDELKLTIDLVRKTELSLGSSQKKVLKIEEENRLKLRKSIVSLVQIDKGEKILENMVGIKRPGTGIEPVDFYNVVGKKAAKKIRQGVPITFEMLNG